MPDGYPSKPLFSFGTLMDATVLSLVAGQPASALRIEPASLPGYTQKLVVAEAFPVVEPDRNGSVPGVAISGLSDTALQRIVFYEGEEYRLKEVEIEWPDRSIANAVFFEDTGVYETADKPWDFYSWQRDEKADFLLRAEKYMQLYGTMSAAEADQYW